MSIIADRGLFVRLLVQSGKFASADAEAFADAMDAATRAPATKDDVIALRAELSGFRNELKADIAELRAELRAETTSLRADISLLSQSVDAMEKRLDTRIDALGDRLMVRIGGLMIALTGALFAALRLSMP